MVACQVPIQLGYPVGSPSLCWWLLLSVVPVPDGYLIFVACKVISRNHMNEPAPAMLLPLCLQCLSKNQVLFSNLLAILRLFFPLSSLDALFSKGRCWKYLWEEATIF